MVEFARLIYLESDIIIIDDISSRLKPSEMILVSRFLKKAKKDGRSIIFIDSDIDNVLRIARQGYNNSQRIYTKYGTCSQIWTD